MSLHELIVDGINALRALGVTFANLMPDTIAMRNKNRAHAIHPLRYLPCRKYTLDSR